MNYWEQIQQSLRSSESVKICIEGCLVDGWTRLPHFFAIICSTHNRNYGLLIFSHPGFGTEGTQINPKHALAIDKSFKFHQVSSSSSSPFNSEVQLELSSGGTIYLAELVIGQATEQFLTILTEVCSGAALNRQSSYDWVTKYNRFNKNGNMISSSQFTDDWPWSQITQVPQDATVPTPVAFDVGDDISNFDPLQPAGPVSTSNVNKDDNLLMFGEFVGETKGSETQKMTSHHNVNDKLIALDLEDFDPLSKGIIDNTDTEQDVYVALHRGSQTMTRRYKDNDTGFEKPADVCVENNDTLDSMPPSLSQDGGRNSYSTFLSTDGSVSRARENFVKLNMAAREKDFTDLSPYSIFIGTWNVNGQLPSESLVPWLCKKSKSLFSSPLHNSQPDIYAIGFQELDLSTEAFVFNDSGREDEWIHCIEKALPPPGKYFKVKHVRLVGMMLVVYAHVKHRKHITYVESETHGTGIMGMMGNKGGVAVRFQMYHTTMCIINSHLAAHLTEYERRNQDFNNVFNNLKFSSFQPPLSISSHDMIFWLGDLNYRFDELSVDEVKRLSSVNDFKKLNRFDQLNKQREMGRTFKNFIESQPTFTPTYKFDPGTDDWDSSEKARAPAWCDRILWKGKNIEQTSYGCHPQLKLSDHKPVSSGFNLSIKVVNHDRQKKVFEEIVRKLDREENESLPQVKLEKQEVSFGELDFMEKKSNCLPIANIGQQIVEFKFIPKLDEKNVSVPWFQINPVAGFIMPGDIVEIELSCCVDKISVPIVTANKFQLNDILVLHLENGKDFFVPLNAEYKPSVFGMSLETLVRVYGPIKAVSRDSLIQLQTGTIIDAGRGQPTDVLEIPKELWLITDHLYKFGMLEENILLEGGIDEELVQIRNYLDNFDAKTEGKIPGGIHSVGNALLLFLETLCEPVIPAKYHGKCLEASSNYILCKQVVNSLPASHFNVFRYVCAFLRDLLKHSRVNNLDAKMLATVFGSILLRSPVDDDNRSRRTHSWTQKKSKFVFQFLVNDFVS